MLLNVIDRPGDAFAAMRHLLTDNHEDRAAQRRHIRQAIAIYRALLAGGVVERLDEPDATGRQVRLTVDLQHDFALNQPLSPFALAALELLDRESPTYALDVRVGHRGDPGRPAAGAVRAAVQGPRRGGRAMKAEGIEYEERMELLEDGHLPEAAGRAARGRVRDVPARATRGSPTTQLAPKSVVRDMYERAMTFAEYVGFYGLARSEGLVLRYLADAYKALRQTVPEEAKTEELTDLIEWLGELVRQVDSSLLDEWEQLRDPSRRRRSARPTDGRPPAGHRATSARSGCWSATRCSAGSSWPRCAATTSWASWTPATAGTPTAWEAALEPYFDEHDEIGTGPDARGPALLHHRRGRAGLARPADLRRPGRRPRLGHHRRGRPGRLRRGRRRPSLRVTDVGQL